MCFKIGYNFKKGKIVRVKECEEDDGEGECKGLLFKEIERWKKQQEMVTQVEASSQPTTISSNCNHSSST
ncbi:hypothetical protein Tsubulata_044105 [Turnera subulata]|uniref:Uncharacterized protein n=1 Tax=Turnera subulata TaxID=218843 RepID=A0A9Q0JP24_9ROSI|nr:hypothetical protein Tsubulata_044105 [Turnera subulata]